MVGGEKHPPPYAIYYIISNGCDFQGQYESVPPQEAITHTLLPLTSQGTALDIRGVRIQNLQLRQPPSPLKGDEDQAKAGFAEINLLVTKVLLTSGSTSNKLHGVTGSPKQLPSPLRRERVFPLWQMGEAEPQFDAGHPQAK
jgi:hypothetical protein